MRADRTDAGWVMLVLLGEQGIAYVQTERVSGDFGECVSPAFTLTSSDRTTISFASLIRKAYECSPIRDEIDPDEVEEEAIAASHQGRVNERLTTCDYQDVCPTPMR